MKALLIFGLFAVLIPSILKAQNSVRVTQNGKGNSVNINQNNDKKTAEINCDGKVTTHKNNNIVIKRSNQRPDKAIKQSHAQTNRVTQNFDAQKVTASQNGAANGLFVILPDSQGSFLNLRSKQKGLGNNVSAFVNDSIRHVNLSQHGSHNSIRVNPCGNHSSSGLSDHSVKVVQKGKGNSASIKHK